MFRFKVLFDGASFSSKPVGFLLRNLSRLHVASVTTFGNDLAIIGYETESTEIMQAFRTLEESGLIKIEKD